MTNINRRYFAAVGGDAPAFEVWPTKKDYHMHEYLLALWGMIVGEMFDLEVSKLDAPRVLLLTVIPETFGDLQRKKKIYLLLDKCTNQP